MFHRLIGNKFKVCDNTCLAYVDRLSYFITKFEVPVSLHSKFKLTGLSWTKSTGPRSPSPGNIFLRRQDPVSLDILHIFDDRLSAVHRIRIDSLLHTIR